MAQKKTTKTNAEKENEKINHFKIWQELLVKPEGVTYKELLNVFKEEVEYETLRKEKEYITGLLKKNGLKLIEETGRSSRFFCRNRQP